MGQIGNHIGIENTLRCMKTKIQHTKTWESVQWDFIAIISY